MSDSLFNPDLLKIQTDIDKVLLVIYYHPNSDRKEVSTTCYSVTSVTSVTYNNSESNSSNISNQVTAESDAYLNKIKTYIQRLLDRDLIQADKNSEWHKYVVTQKGREHCEIIIKDYQEKVQAVLNAEQKKHDIIQKIDDLKEYLPKCNLLSNPVKISLLDLQRYHPYLVDSFLDDPSETYKCLEIASDDLGFKDRDFVISDTPKSIMYDINALRSSQWNKLIAIQGEIVSRSQARLILVSATFECPGCGNTITVLQLGSDFKQPSSCGCGRKGKFRIIKRDISDSLNVTIRDLYELVPNGTVPEQVDCLFKKDVYGFSSMNEGDRIRIIGMLVEAPLSNKSNNNTVEYSKMIKVYGVERLDAKFTLSIISDKDMIDFKEISKDPILWHNKIFFDDLHSVEKQSRIILSSLYSNISVLSVGDPGSGKSEMQKRIINNIIRGKVVMVAGNNSSPSGVIGSASKNPFTGKYSLNGGVLRPMHPHGFVAVDELNRDKDFEIQSALLGVMSDRRLRINKADINVDTPCDVTIWATCNPINNIYDENKLDYVNFGVLNPLWDRFDLIVYYAGESLFDEKLLLDLFINKKDRFELDSNISDLFRKYLLYSNSIEVVLDSGDLKKLVASYTKFYSAINPGTGFRKIDTLKKLLIGICRMHHRNKPIDADFILLNDLILDLKLLRDNYILSKRE